jgi:hypothetical protein
MTQMELIELLLANGFMNGWALSEDVLVFWEHDENPPAPLTRPTDEILTADSADA